MPVQASNVALIDPQTNRPTRLGVRYTADGTKELFAKRSGARIRTLAKPNPKYAAKR
jgi:large subunit ribosomal protein L24